MGRAELLFGVFAADRTTHPSGRHALPDHTRPLRSQGGGRTPARRQILRWQRRLWFAAMRRKRNWHRAITVGLTGSLASVFLVSGFWRITALSLLMIFRHPDRRRLVRSHLRLRTRQPV